MSKPAALTDQDTTVRVAPDVKADLMRLQREHREEHRGTISFSDIIRGLIDDRKPVQP